MLGWPSVAWGLAHISSLELAEWMAYARIEPFGAERADVPLAMLMALTAEINRDKKKRRKHYSPSDFMPRFETDVAEPEKKSQTWEEQLQVVEALNRAFKGKDQRPKDGHGNKPAAGRDDPITAKV